MNWISFSVLVLATLPSLPSMPMAERTRIIGGDEVEIQDVPYQVALLENGFFSFCGGTIVAPRFVLTAAHCFPPPIGNFSVRLGSPNAYVGGRTIPVKKITIHEKYGAEDKHDYDFALLELNEEIKFDRTMQPASLPQENERVPIGHPMIVSGWGETKNLDESSMCIRRTVVPKVRQRECARAYDPKAKITGRMLCGGLTKGGKDACQGDSGGPLVKNGTLVGVVSWGFGCGDAKFPGVYARVASVIPWIKENMNKN